MKAVLVRRVDSLVAGELPPMPKFVAVSDTFAADEAYIRWDASEKKRAYPMRDWVIDYAHEELVEHFGATAETVLALATEAQWYDEVILGVKNA